MATITRDRVEQALRRAKDWLLANQITAATKTYDTLECDDAEQRTGRWVDGPVPPGQVGAFYGNLWRSPAFGAEGEVRRQYHNIWHSAQCAVALLDYLDFENDPAVRAAVDSAWGFVRRRQVTDGEFRGVFVEHDLPLMRFPLRFDYSLSRQKPRSYECYNGYDNMETDLFPLELHRRRGDEAALRVARDNAAFFLERHPDHVFFEVETEIRSISGMDNDAIYGRLGAATGEARFAEAFARQVRRLSLLGLDLRAGNNVRNMYWDATCVAWAVEQDHPLRDAALPLLAFLCEHVRAAQQPSGVLWMHLREPGVPDPDVDQTQDGAATLGMVRMWGTMYDVTGDRRWLAAIRAAVAWALDHQYPADDHPGFAGAFEYGGWVTKGGHRFEMLRDISTAWGVRALVPLLTGGRRWAEEFWKQAGQ